MHIIGGTLLHALVGVGRGQGDYIYKTNLVIVREGKGEGPLVFEGWGSVHVPSGMRIHGGSWFGLAIPIFIRWQG